METAVGIFSSRKDAEGAVRDLRAHGIPADHVQLLLPETSGLDLPGVPTDEAEPPWAPLRDSGWAPWRRVS